jgi:preprotein translocase subunit SecB
METSISKFQFKGYRINRSLIELDENSNFENLKISFAVSGLVKRVENLFILNLSVKIKNNESNLKIEVDTIANFLFEKVENIDDISSFFYNNSSAILFPYIRAYISTLTNLSGNRSITLPTMNLTNLADELRANTTII